LKTCTRCKAEKELTEFHSEKHGKYGVRSKCKICMQEERVARIAKDPEKYRADTKRWRENNLERRRKQARRWLADNRATANKNLANYRAAKLKRTPLWADLVEIDYVYHAAQVIKDVYGTSWDVDHIIPLQGENVSGLHVQGNLQIMPPSQNRSKGNSFTC
jgi:5-methylcytosine-specific restriction endonuclease McrA